jgi:hypothetical protein
VPYRLATAQQTLNFFYLYRAESSRKVKTATSNLRMPGSKPGALPIFTQTWGDGPTNAKLFLLDIAQEVHES